jgi:hypothetical protein
MVRGPGINNWNLSGSKYFQPTERLKVEFRADMYNAFNHAQWSGVNTTFNDRTGNTFGWVNGARDGRVVTAALRVLF